MASSNNNNQQFQEQFEKFQKENPNGCYEEWIRTLHPTEASDGLLDLGSTIIDAKYYYEDTPELQFWNTHAKTPVAATPKANKGESSLFLDFLSDEEAGKDENDSQSSPQSIPRRTIQPGEDLLKFD